MRRPLAAIALFLLLAPQASAQVGGGQAARTLPTPAEIAARASLDTSALLAAYMARLAAAGNAPSQADIDEATRQYFTNGAAATSVPSSGPGAEYFRNGATVTGVPSSGPGAAYFQRGAEVMAYQAPPRAPSTPEAGRAAPKSGAGWVESEEDAGAPMAAASAAEAAPNGPTATRPAPAEVPAPSGPPGLTCSPLEIEAAMAIARQFAASAAAPSCAPCAPSTPSSPTPQRSGTAPLGAAEPVPVCPTAPSAPSAPSLLSRLVPALGGAFLGGFVVALRRQRERASTRSRRG